MLLTRGVSIAFTLFLTRLLAPEAFGVIAMMSVFFELANIVVNSGLQQALIRTPTVSDTDLSTAFFSNILFSTIAYVGLFFIAPVAADFYEQPSLTDLIRIAGIVLFVNSLIIVQDALLRRHMRFRALMHATVSGTLASGILALIMAYSGLGVWSLVGQMVTAQLITGVLIWHQGAWTPTCEFSIASFRQMYRFGYKLLLESTIEVLYRNSFFVVIGKLFSAELVGLYFLASKINDLVVPQIAGAVSQASFPALSPLQDRPDELRQMYRRITSMTMFLVAPLIAGMVVLSPTIFDVFLDLRWQQSATFLQLFCLAGLLFPLHLMNYNILNIMGRSDLVLFLGIVRKAANVVVLIFSVPYGIHGILIGQILTSILALGPNTYYTAKLLNYGLIAQLSDITRPVIAATASGFVVMIIISLIPEEPIVLLVIGSLVGIICYFAIVRIIFCQGITVLKQFIVHTNIRIF